MAGQQVSGPVAWTNFMRSGDEVNLVGNALGYGAKSMSAMIENTSVQFQRMPAHLRAQIESETLLKIAED